MRVGLFITCLADTLFPEIGKAVVRVLEHLGHEVVFPPEQTCCGQMHINSGYRAEALDLARHLAAAFAEVELVVSPSSSCVGAVRELYPVLAREAGDQSLADEAHQLGSRMFELSELLVHRLGVEDVGASFPHRVTYHATCHSQRVARIGDGPLRLLRAVSGLELIELPDVSECCGFGGTFAIKNADTSLAILADKCRNIQATRAEYCVAVDPSCLLQIGGGLSRQRTGVRALHLAEVLGTGRSA